MKYAIAVIIFTCSPLLQASEESANDIAKRVIALPIKKNPLTDEKSTMGIGPSVDHMQLACADDASRSFLQTYMLSESVTEKVRITYAIALIARGAHSGFGNLPVGTTSNAKNNPFLKDASVLIARLNEIIEAEIASTGQTATRPESKSKGSNKPQSEEEGRSR